MFTGIIEQTGSITRIEEEGGNKHYYISAPFTHELKVDQSVAHNGVCLTVVDIGDSGYKVTAIAETLSRTNLGQLKVHDKVNLERCMLANSRFDGHIVQGHVDTTVTCHGISDMNGSFEFSFALTDPSHTKLLVEKGSVCLNGVSLTVVKAEPHLFSVHLIPYTIEHTNFKTLRVDDAVNAEFDIIGKYIARQLLARELPPAGEQPRHK